MSEHWKLKWELQRGSLGLRTNAVRCISVGPLLIIPLKQQFVITWISSFTLAGIPSWFSWKSWLRCAIVTNQDTNTSAAVECKDSIHLIDLAKGAMISTSFVRSISNLQCCCVAQTLDMVLWGNQKVNGEAVLTGILVCKVSSPAIDFNASNPCKMDFPTQYNILNQVSSNFSNPQPMFIFFQQSSNCFIVHC